MKTVPFLLIPFCLCLASCKHRPADLYPASPAKADPDAAAVRLPPHVMPVIGCWFWVDRVLQPADFEPYLDKLGRHAHYNLLTTSFRIPEREITEAGFHQQVKAAAAYARKKGMSLVVDLDVRLARRAFQEAYPDELQEMVMLREVEWTGQQPLETLVHSLDLSDHYTHRTTHYIPLEGSFLRAYAYELSGERIIPGSLHDITGSCEVLSETKDSVKISVSDSPHRVSSHVCILVSFTHLAPDVFAPHLLEFQRELIRSYADVPLAGACKDEWGFPPNFTGNPQKDQFWYSRHRAEAYAEKTGGRELLADLLLMHRGMQGRESERQMVINHFMEMSYLRNTDLEDDFHRTVKEVFGPKAVSATHPTWWPYPDLREYKKNGLHWWAATRDWAQTDEYTPYPVRTALAKKWNSPHWYNMYYARDVQTYERRLWTHAMAGGRINYHPIYPAPEGLVERDLELLKGDLMRGDCRIRLLNYISDNPRDCPVAIVFGHTCTMNWAGPAYDDVGMALADSLMRAGIAVDLIPASEIQNSSLGMDDDGWILYGPQRYAAVVLYHPEFEREKTATFFGLAADGKTSLYRVGEWTLDFNGQAFDGQAALPASMTASEDIQDIVSKIKVDLNRRGTNLQSSATGTMAYGRKPVSEPPAKGFLYLIDGTFIELAGQDHVAGDTIYVHRMVNGFPVTFDAVGVAAIRLNREGRVEAMAAGGLRSVHAPGLEIAMDERMDVALWINAEGEWEGVVQGWEGDIPPDLLELTGSWSRLALPVPYDNP
jgi:hypothetical protein